ncbi:MAG: hypothetical protein ACREEM_11360 [Blastocatellia bacterium]
MSQPITLTITEDERAELEAMLDLFIAEIRKDKAERDPSALQGYQNLDDRAKLEVWLDALIAERRADKGEHERTMARVDERIRRTRQLLEQTHAKLGIA